MTEDTPPEPLARAPLTPADLEPIATPLPQPGAIRAQVPAPPLIVRSVPPPEDDAPRSPRRRAARSSRLGPGERRRALEISTFEGMLATAHAALTGIATGGNVFSYGFALLLGATNVHLGVLTAMPQLATAAQAISAAILRRARSRRALVMVSAGIWRGLFFVAPLLAFLLPKTAALWAFIALYGVAAVSFQFAGNGWNSWMADLVPGPIRGRYFSRRNNLCNLVGLVTGVGGALALDAWAGARPGHSPEADARRLLGFLVVFPLAALLGEISTWLLRYQPEPERTAVPSEDAELPLSDFVLAPFQDARMRRILAFFGLYAIGSGLGAPYWVPFVIEELHGTYGLLTILTLVGGVAGLLTLPLWGRALDRFGARPVIAIAGVVGSSHPLYYLLASPGMTVPVWFDYTSSGVIWGGWNIAVLDLILNVAPRSRGRRAMYLAAYAGVQGTALALASFLSGLLVDTIPGERRTIFACVSAIRLGAVLLLLRGIQEPGAQPVMAVLSHAGRAIGDVTRRRRRASEREGDPKA